MRPALVVACLILGLTPGQTLAQTSGDTTGGITIGSGNTVTIGVPPSGGGSAAATICGTVTALTSSSITLLAVLGAPGSVNLTIPATVPVPAPLTTGALACVLEMGGTVTRFLSPCSGVPSGPSSGAVGGSVTTIGNLTLSGPVLIAGNTTSDGVTVDLAGIMIAGTPVIVQGNVCGQVQVTANSQTIVATVTSGGAGPGSSCGNGCVPVGSAGGNSGPRSSEASHGVAADSATVVHRVGPVVVF